MRSLRMVVALVALCSSLVAFGPASATTEGTISSSSPELDWAGIILAPSLNQCVSTNLNCDDFYLGVDQSGSWLAEISIEPYYDDGSPLDIDVFVYDSTGRLLGESTTPTAYEKLRFVGPAGGGPYRVQVAAWISDSVDVAYLGHAKFITAYPFELPTDAPSAAAQIYDEMCQPSGGLLLAEIYVPSSSWVSFRLNVPAGETYEYRTSSAHSNHRRSGFILYTEDIVDGQSSYPWFIYRASESEVRVHFEDDGATDRVFDAHFGNQGSCGFGWGGTRTTPREVRKTFVRASDGNSDFWVRIFGSENTSLLNLTFGGDAFLVSEEGFTGGNSTILKALGYGFSRIENTSVEKQLGSEFLGFFESKGAHSRIGYDSPSGPHDDDHLYLFQGNTDPGTYRFRIDHAVDDPMIVLMGANVDFA